MRILHVIRSLNPGHGGPVESVRQFGAVMTGRGVDVEVATLDGAQAPWVKEFPLKVHACGPGALAYGYTPRLSSWLQSNVRHYDALIVNGIWEYHSFCVWRNTRRWNVPYFVFTHGMLDPWFRRTYPLKHLKKSLYWPWGGYPVLRDASAVLFTAEEERVLARQSFPLYSCREIVVSYGTAGPSGSAQDQKSAFLARYPHLAGKRLVLWMGRIHPKKGCDLAIEAFADALTNAPDYHLVFAGPDQTGWQRDLAARASALGITERVTWTGMLAGDAKWGAYRASDAFLLPSHQENFGIVVAEALACGLPALISDKVNIWREVSQDGAGLVASDDRQGAGQLLREWHSMTGEQKTEMREKARICFERRFEIDKAAESILACVSAVLN